MSFIQIDESAWDAYDEAMEQAQHEADERERETQDRRKLRVNELCMALRAGPVSLLEALGLIEEHVRSIGVLDSDELRQISEALVEVIPADQAAEHRDIAGSAERLGSEQRAVFTGLFEKGLRWTCNQEPPRSLDKIRSLLDSLIQVRGSSETTLAVLIADSVAAEAVSGVALEIETQGIQQLVNAPLVHKCCFARLLARAQKGEVLGGILRSVRDRDADPRLIVQAIGAERCALDCVVELLGSSPSCSARTEAVRWLSQWAAREMDVERVEAAVVSAVSKARSHEVAGFVRLAHTCGFLLSSKMLTALEDPLKDPAVRHEIRNCGPSALTPSRALDAVCHPDPVVRRNAVKIAVATRSRSAVPMLLAGIFDPDIDVAITSVEGLGEFQDDGRAEAALAFIGKWYHGFPRRLRRAAARRGRARM